MPPIVNASPLFHHLMFLPIESHPWGATLHLYKAQMTSMLLFYFMFNEFFVAIPYPKKPKVTSHHTFY